VKQEPGASTGLESGDGSDRVTENSANLEHAIRIPAYSVTRVDCFELLGSSSSVKEILIGRVSQLARLSRLCISGHTGCYFVQAPTLTI
jgi:hypothetical protein